MKICTPLIRVALLVLALFATGCIGGFVYHDVVTQIDAPQIDPELRGWIRSNPKVSAMTGGDVMRLWGQPDSVGRADGIERWTYVSDSWRWNGVIPVLILLPIPLLVPVGHERVTLTLADDQVRSVEFLRDADGAAVFGLILGHGLSFAEVYWDDGGLAAEWWVDTSWLERSEAAEP